MDILTIGEVLIDLTQTGKDEKGIPQFAANPGGAPANLAVAAARLGAQTAFIGKVGADAFGRYLTDVLNENCVDASHVAVDADHPTTMAVVSVDATGERDFSFYRNFGADVFLEKEDINADIIRNSRIFHFGSLSLTAEPARSTTEYALDIAKKAGCTVTYDPNYREPLWDNRENAMERMKSILPFVDIMKLSDEETALLTPFEDPKEAAEYLLGTGVRLVAVTLGSEGVLICSRDGSRKVPGFVSHVVDTTGAGDSFWGAFVSQLIRADKSLEEFSIDELEEFARYGNAVASLCVEKRGGLRSIPEESETFERLAVK